MSDELKTKIDWSCRFAKHKYEIYEGCLRIVEHTNLAYVEPHKVIINNRLYLFFNEQKYFYIGNLQNKIPLAELSEYIARHLLSVSKDCEKRYNILMNNYIKNDEKLSEKNKENNQIEWVQLMNNYKNMAEEIILRELIYV